MSARPTLATLQKDLAEAKRDRDRACRREAAQFESLRIAREDCHRLGRSVHRLRATVEEQACLIAELRQDARDRAGRLERIATAADPDLPF